MSPAAAAWTPARRPAASPMCCSGAAPARWWPSTSVTGSWSGGCRPTSGSRLHDRTNVRTLTPEAIGGPAELIVADLSFISLNLVLPALTACAGTGRRPAADGQTAVRGRPGAARRRRCGARSRPSRGCGGRRWFGRLVYWGGAWPVWSPPRYPDRAAMWSSSCTCDKTPRPTTRPRSAARQAIADAVEKGAAMTRPPDAAGRPHRPGGHRDHRRRRRRPGCTRRASNWSRWPAKAANSTWPCSTRRHRRRSDRDRAGPRR